MSLTAHSLSEDQSLTLGYCGPLLRPTLVLPSSVANANVSATGEHERVHYVLFQSTTFGIIQKLLAHLLEYNCQHFSRAYLIRCLQHARRVSASVHEGCAVLNKLAGDAPPFYQHAHRLFAPLVGRFELPLGLRSWIGLQIAAVCLSPELPDSLFDPDTYSSKALHTIMGIPEISPSKRLAMLRRDMHSPRFASLVTSVRSCIEESLALVGATEDIPPSFESERRGQFISICEPRIEQCFQSHYPGWYQCWGTYYTRVRPWDRLRDAFNKKGCICLNGVTQRTINLRETSQVVMAARTQTPGAIVCSSFEDLRLFRGQLGYKFLCFCDRNVPFQICSNPVRQLLPRHLYVRLHPCGQQGLSLPFFAATTVDPDNIQAALKLIAELRGPFILTPHGSLADLLMRIDLCIDQGLAPLYIQIDRAGIDDVRRMVEMLFTASSKMIAVTETSFMSMILLVRGISSDVTLLLPTTGEVVQELAHCFNRMIRCEPFDMFVHSPECIDYDALCIDHLFRWGW